MQPIATGDERVPLEWIDTHAHLDDERFRDDLPAVLERAAHAGLSRIVVVATTALDSPRCVELATKQPILRATVGIQPNHVAEASPTAWDEVVALADRPEVVALGETGLDRYWDYTPFAQQEDYFARHLQLARKFGRAVVIHCREAEADTVRMLRADFDKHGPVRAMMHSFTGDWPTAEACLAMGLHISFAGMLTYKNANDLRAVAAKAPLNRVLIETDCPYLAPVPVRGKRNEPANVVHTAAVLAQTLGVTLDVIAENTTRNARALFGFV
jgi:TatD DNase family protein